MINAVHSILFARDADAARAFFADVLGMQSVDAGGGWLIFALPPAELAVHPTEGEPRQELYLMTDDLEATLGAMRERGITITSEPSDQGWGCPSCGAELVELERSGVRIDACRQCRGVWLDRGELDHILERERKVVGAADDDDENFIREMTGGGKAPKQGYGFDMKAAEKIYSDYRSHKKHKKRKSVLDDLFG